MYFQKSNKIVILKILKNSDILNFHKFPFPQNIKGKDMAHFRNFVVFEYVQNLKTTQPQQSLSKRTNGYAVA